MPLSKHLELRTVIALGSLQHKNTLWRTALASNSPCDIQLFKEVRNQYTQSVRKAKASFFKQKFASCSSNYKTFWDTVKSTKNKSTSSQLPTALRLGNTVTIVATPITSLFNLSFVSSEIPKDWKAAAEFSVSNRRACCPDLWQFLWGYHRVQFSS